MKTITVHASQTYPIWIGRGLLGQCGSYLKQQTKAQTAAVITDDHVDMLWAIPTTFIPIESQSISAWISWQIRTSSSAITTFKISMFSVPIT